MSDNQEIEIKTIETTEPVNPARRNMFKLTGVAAAMAAVGGSGAAVAKRVQGIPQDGFPAEIDEALFKQHEQRNILFTFAFSSKLQQEYPERTTKFANLVGEPEWTFDECKMNLLKAQGPAPVSLDNNKPGYRQVDFALAMAAMHPQKFVARLGKFGEVNPPGLCSWEQHNLHPNKWQFESKAEAAQYIKRAALSYGAARVGITDNDERFNYSPLYDFFKNEEVSWDELGFKPKSVIVMLHDQDYDAIRTAPALPAAAAFGKAYTDMAVQAGALADFFRRLGYKAVASHNDMNNKVAYAIKAGLGEGARNGQLIAPHLGPRVRISAVITEFDFVDYDQPRDFGITKFCDHCKLCAERCPADAISMDDARSYTPTYEGADDPDLTWHSQIGVKKYYNDAKKCFKFWGENGIGCIQCVKACPWNKPDFWHHRMIDASNTFTSGPIHTFMKQMDILFGYGDMDISDATRLFWQKEFKA